MSHSSEPEDNRFAATPETVPLLEEVALVSKREAVTGKVRVSTHVDVSHELARATLQTETVEVTRVPIDRILDRAVDVRVEGDTTIIPVMEEVLIVEKRLVLKEELHVKRKMRTEDVETPVTLRKQRAVVERLDVSDQGENGRRES